MATLSSSSGNGSEKTLHKYKLLCLVDLADFRNDVEGNNISISRWKSPEFADEMKVALGRLLVSVIRNRQVDLKEPWSDDSKATLRKTLDIKWTFRLFHSSLQISCSEITGHIPNVGMDQGWNKPFSEASSESLRLPHFFEVSFRAEAGRAFETI